jgi:protein-arginine kinase activator protein McsA
MKLKCKICKKKEATVHLTKFAGDKTRKLADLCDECAQTNGLGSALISLESVLHILKAPETAA